MPLGVQVSFSVSPSPQKRLGEGWSTNGRLGSQSRQDAVTCVPAITLPPSHLWSPSKSRGHPSWLSCWPSCAPEQSCFCFLHFPSSSSWSCDLPSSFCLPMPSPIPFSSLSNVAPASQSASHKETVLSQLSKEGRWALLILAMRLYKSTFSALPTS